MKKGGQLMGVITRSHEKIFKKKYVFVQWLSTIIIIIIFLSMYPNNP